MTMIEDSDTSPAGATRTYMIAVVVNAATEAELPAHAELVGGISEGLPEAWFDAEEGDPFAITSMLTNAAWPDPDASTVTVTKIAALETMVRQAEAAALGDSNDSEINALREALQEACGLLGMDWPELTEEEIAAGEAGEFSQFRF